LPPALARATIPAPVLEVIQGLERAGYAAVLVGGCVRDLLRGAPPKDFDIASSARPEQAWRVLSVRPVAC
jgi:tRNA nucleotidyltransferase (CCA-adding enzyme)